MYLVFLVRQQFKSPFLNLSLLQQTFLIVYFRKRRIFATYFVLFLHILRIFPSLCLSLCQRLDLNLRNVSIFPNTVIDFTKLPCQASGRPPRRRAPALSWSSSTPRAETTRGWSSSASSSSSSTRLKCLTWWTEDRSSGTRLFLSNYE